MKKVGFSAGCPDGDISSLSNQLKKFKELGVDSLEIQIFSMDVIMGKKINQPELKILKDTLLNQDIEYSVHGALSVNLLNHVFPLRQCRHKTIVKLHFLEDLMLVKVL